MRFILKSSAGGGGKRKRKTDQRAGSQDEKVGVAQELRQQPGRKDLGKRREGKKAENFKFFLCCSSAPARPCAPTVQPRGLGSCTNRSSKLGREQHDPTCLREGKNSSAIKSSLAASSFQIGGLGEVEWKKINIHGVVHFNRTPGKRRF